MATYLVVATVFLTLALVGTILKIRGSIEGEYFKVFSTLFLFTYVLVCTTTIPTISTILLAIGLFIINIGDFFLGIMMHYNKNKERTFGIGLACFLLAYVLIIIAIVLHASNIIFNPWLLIPSAIVVLSSINNYICFDKKGKNALPVAIYIGIMTILFILSLFVNNTLLIIAVALLYLGDQSLGYRTFCSQWEKMNYALSESLVLVPYYLGLALLVLALLF